jgi:MFS transporter, NNP family, nitrate/nitrite transporter
MADEETKFDLPVDSEHKALKIKLHSFAHPHMRAFHVIWFAFFNVFVSTFAPAAMQPVIREDIGINAKELANAGVFLFLLFVHGPDFFSQLAQCLIAE